MVDYLDNELDSKIEGMLSPNCYPTHFNLTADFDKIVGKSQEEKEALNLPKYYISQLIGIKADDSPPYKVIDKTEVDRALDEAEQFKDFVIKISALRDADDACDKVGIKFIAKFLAHYDDNPNVKPHVHDYILGIKEPYKVQQIQQDLKVIKIAEEAVNSEKEKKND